MRTPGHVPSAHSDRFAQRQLPEHSLWPAFEYLAPHPAHFPDRINAATLIDRAIERGWGDRPVYFYENAVWTFAHLRDRADSDRARTRRGFRPGAPQSGPAAKLESALPGSAVQRSVSFTAIGDGRGRATDLDRAAGAKPAGVRPVDTAADDIALIRFTSETTGRPKAAAHFHRDVFAMAECYPRVHPVTAADVISGSPSIAFTHRLAAFLVFPLRFGASVALLPRPTPEYMLDAITRHRVTSLYAVPTAYNRLLDTIERHDVSSVAKYASAGEPLPIALFERFRVRTGISLFNGIALTEMGTHFLSDTLPADKPGSTGGAVPGYTACILDENGAVLPPGSRGRIAVRRPTGCMYLNDEVHQQRYVEKGWNVTGDLVDQDETGCSWFVDRPDDLIVSAGYNISPCEIEQVLLQHPAVRECAVIGEPDPERGNLVCACVVLRNPGDASDTLVARLQTFVKSRVAAYKYPRRIRFYESLLRTETSKLQRFRLRTPS